MKARQDPEFKKINALLQIIPESYTEKKAEPKKEDDKDFMKELEKVIKNPKEHEKAEVNKALYNAGVLLLNKKISYEDWVDILLSLYKYVSKTDFGLPFQFNIGQAPPKFRLKLSKLVRRFTDAENSSDWQKLYKEWIDILPAKTTTKLK